MALGNEDIGFDAERGGADNGGMDRLNHLEKRVDAIDGRLGRIENDVASLKIDVSSLKGDVTSLKDGISDVKVAIASLDAKLDIANIRASVEKTHTDIYKWVASLSLGAIVLGLSVYFGSQRINQQIVHAVAPAATLQPGSARP